MVAFCREHELANLADGLAGLAVLSVVRGDSELARQCREELDGVAHPGSVESVPYRRLAAAFVELAEGTTGGTRRDRGGRLRRSSATRRALLPRARNGAPRRQHRGHRPDGARQLLAAADDERRAVGALAWPLEPYRDAARRALANCP